ncbi:hypothetical protein C8R45DRAFT_1207765 [Mycena sanguinolenta]|nr:hypothetical protein C8R45DRAFT_1207765 [Mycena sanguinolenta]
MVPQELIDAILSDVDDDDDGDSLRACALVSRRFILPAQRLLFKEMSFPMQQNVRGQPHGQGAEHPITLLVQRASDILSSSPHSIAFVRQLNVGSMYWEEGWDALKDLLCTLRPAKIAYFSMQGSLANIPSDVNVAIAGIFAQPSLQKAKLWSWDHILPSTLIAAFALCQNVFVRCSSFEMATAVDLASPSNQGYFSPAIDVDGATPLECLTMKIDCGVGDFLLQPTISRLIRGLRELEILQFSQIYPDALTAAHLCSTTLTHLVLHVLEGFESAEFPHLGALRVLTLTTTGSDAWATSMEIFAPLLPASLPRLEVLNVSAIFPLYKDKDSMPPTPALDAALTALAFLREVNITIPRTAPAMQLMHYQKSVEEELPAVHAAGLLIFSQTDTTHAY